MRKHSLQYISYLTFIVGVQLHHDQVLVLEDRAFHCKVLSRQKFNILANFNLVLSTSFMVTWSLLKNVQRFGG